MKPTKLNKSLSLINATFGTLVEALEYAAAGETGCNFYNGRGELDVTLTYAELKSSQNILLPS